MNPYQALANAIVELAVKDYKKALKQHYRCLLYTSPSPRD